MKKETKTISVKLQHKGLKAIIRKSEKIGRLGKQIEKEIAELNTMKVTLNINK